MTDPTTIALAREVLALAEKATPGPWEWHTGCSWKRLSTQTGRTGDVLCPAINRYDRHPELDVSEENMDFIAHTRTSAPALARALLEAQEENERLRTALGFYAPHERYESTNRRNDGTDPFTSADDPYYMDIGRDYGAVARAALRPVAPSEKDGP